MLDRLFGERLFSARTVAVSACLSFASLHLMSSLLSRTADHVLAGRLPNQAQFASPQDAFVAYFGRMLWAMAKLFLLASTPSQPTAMNIVAVLALIVVVASVIVPRLRWLLLFFSALGVLFLIGMVAFARPYPDWIGWPDVVLGAVTVGVVCDAGALALTRALIAWQTEWMSFPRLIVAGILELFVALLLLTAPVFVGLSVMSRSVGKSLHAGFLGWGAMLAPTTNVLTAAIALALFGAATLLVVHRMMWPVVARPLYRLARLRVFGSTAGRTALFGLGSAAVSIGLGWANAIIDHLYSLFVAS